MHYLVYVSAATKPLSGDELNKILSVSRENNKRDDITGILLYSEGAFMQVLEGSNDAVDAAFKRISNDQRHTGIIKLAQGETLERHFGNWPMGFKKATSKEFSQFSSFAKPGENDVEDELHPSVSILKNFLETTGAYLAVGMLLNVVKG